ncbi:MAG: 2,3-bisphosphoglycerate-independent phosphoglycerate mutase [Coriobacteriales bacterium]|jgi:2,3-bisphosphoglycerate-independent phosphoglycerate mutase
MKSPALLVIIDGFGIDAPGPGNAASLANKPFIDSLLSGDVYPARTIEASGEDVGLPAGQMGNSEVGHLNIGSGRIVYQDLSRINNAVADGTFFTNPAFTKLFSDVKKNGGALHVMGLLSDGGVHSEFTHLKAVLEMAAQSGVGRIIVHPFLDGRDVSPTSGVKYLKELEKLVKIISTDSDNIVEIGSIGGRYYAMDRDNRWDRVKNAWDVIAIPDPANHHIETSLTPSEAAERSYANGVTDEFVEPISFTDRGVRDGDGIAFINFRPDRAREITRAFTQEDFKEFDRPIFPKVGYVCMTEYDETFDLPVAFPKEVPEMVLADKISELGYKQFHIAETEKYAHVTFFLNGGVEAPKEGEQRVLIPSPKVATYDLQPEMSAVEITDKLTAAMSEGAAEFYIVNYANCDMVGHTGNIEAAKVAVETVDKCLERLIGLLVELKGVAIVTADHGNVEKMINDDGTPHTAHTTASVPFVVIDASGDGRKIELEDGEGRLADIAPTLFDLAGIDDVPSEWTGRSLIKK